MLAFFNGLVVEAATRRPLLTDSYITNNLWIPSFDSITINFLNDDSLVNSVAAGSRSRTVEYRLTVGCFSTRDVLSCVGCVLYPPLRIVYFHRLALMETVT